MISEEELGRIGNRFWEALDDDVATVKTSVWGFGGNPERGMEVTIRATTATIKKLLEKLEN
jgi:hypothetical protein